MALDPRRRVPTTFNKPKSRSTAIVPSASRAVAVGPRPVRRTTRNPSAKRRLDSVFDDWQYKKRRYTGPAGSRPAQPSRKRPAAASSKDANMDRVVDRMSKLTRQYDREMEKLTRLMRSIQMRNKRARR